MRSNCQRILKPSLLSLRVSPTWGYRFGNNVDKVQGGQGLHDGLGVGSSNIQQQSFGTLRYRFEQQQAEAEHQGATKRQPLSDSNAQLFGAINQEERVNTDSPVIQIINKQDSFGKSVTFESDRRSVAGNCSPLLASEDIQVNKQIEALERAYKKQLKEILNKTSDKQQASGMSRSNEQQSSRSQSNYFTPQSRSQVSQDVRTLSPSTGKGVNLQAANNETFVLSNRGLLNENGRGKEDFEEKQFLDKQQGRSQLNNDFKNNFNDLQQPIRQNMRGQVMDQGYRYHRSNDSHQESIDEQFKFSPRPLEKDKMPFQSKSKERFEDELGNDSWAVSRRVVLSDDSSSDDSDFEASRDRRRRIKDKVLKRNKDRTSKAKQNKSESKYSRSSEKSSSRSSNKKNTSENNQVRKKRSGRGNDSLDDDGSSSSSSSDSENSSSCNSGGGGNYNGSSSSRKKKEGKKKNMKNKKRSKGKESSSEGESEFKKQGRKEERSARGRLSNNASRAWELLRKSGLTYNGKRDGTGIQFLKKIQDFKRQHNLFDSEMLQIISSILTSTAYTWCSIILQKAKTWKQFVEAFKDTYVGEDYSRRMKFLAHTTLQKEDEDIEDFLLKLEDILNETNLDQDDRVECAWNNILPVYRMKFEITDFKDIEDMIPRMRRFQRDWIKDGRVKTGTEGVGNEKQPKRGAIHLTL